jgi:hypothetical protein
MDLRSSEPEFRGLMIDGWTPEEALREMLSFHRKGFSHPAMKAYILDFRAHLAIPIRVAALAAIWCVAAVWYRCTRASADHHSYLSSFSCSWPPICNPRATPSLTARSARRPTFEALLGGACGGDSSHMELVDRRSVSNSPLEPDPTEDAEATASASW